MNFSMSQILNPDQQSCNLALSLMKMEKRRAKTGSVANQPNTPPAAIATWDVGNGIFHFGDIPARLHGVARR